MQNRNDFGLPDVFGIGHRLNAQNQLMAAGSITIDSSKVDGTPIEYMGNSADFTPAPQDVSGFFARLREELEGDNILDKAFEYGFGSTDPLNVVKSRMKL